MQKAPPPGSLDMAFLYILSGASSPNKSRFKAVSAASGLGPYPENNKLTSTAIIYKTRLSIIGSTMLYALDVRLRSG